MGEGRKGWGVEWRITTITVSIHLLRKSVPVILLCEPSSETSCWVAFALHSRSEREWDALGTATSTPPSSGAGRE